jgi:glycolate oxidase iron-sulfur subunit
MEQTRAKLEEVHPKSTLRRYLYTKLLRSRTKLDLLQSVLSLFTRLGGAPIAHSAGRALRTIAPRMSAMLRLTPGRVQQPKARLTRSADGATKGRVAFLVGCIGDTFTSEVNDATIRLLQWLGYDVVPITNETCCGALAIHAGYRDEAIGMGSAMMKAALDTNADFILSNIAGCGAMLKDYAHLLPDSPERGRFSAKVRDITEFLAENCLEDLAQLRANELTEIAYQAPCHLLHAQKVVDAPMRVIAAVGNVSVHQLAENELCCGSAGTYNIEHPVEADALLERKVQSVKSDTSRIVLTANAGCLMQLRKGLREADVTTQVYHIIEWLASLIPTAR